MSVLDRLRGVFRGKPGAAVRDSMMFAGRARLITHLFDEWGEEASSEFSFDSKPPGFDPLLVFEFAPWRARTWWTYSTAGLSLCPAMDNHPPTELIAYSESQAQGLVDLLHQLAFKEDGALYYRSGDLVSFDTDPPDLGIPLGRHYGLVPAQETTGVMNFPDVTVRPEDQRYIMARPGEDRSGIQWLRVIPLADADRARWELVRTDIDTSRAWQLL